MCNQVLDCIETCLYWMWSFSVKKPFSSFSNWTNLKSCMDFSLDSPSEYKCKWYNLRINHIPSTNLLLHFKLNLKRRKRWGLDGCVVKYHNLLNTHMSFTLCLFFLFFGLHAAVVWPSSALTPYLEVFRKQNAASSERVDRSPFGSTIYLNSPTMVKVRTTNIYKNTSLAAFLSDCNNTGGEWRQGEIWERRGQGEIHHSPTQHASELIL